MSQLEDLKDRFKAIGARLGEQIQESESYTKLQDRYQSLSASGQKLVWIFGIISVMLVLLFYPTTQLTTSQELITSFEEKRGLIRDLFKTYRESSGNSTVAVPPPQETLRNAIESVLTVANLIPEQRVGLIQSTAEGRLIPASLVGYVMEVKLAKLNLKQIVDIGTAINAISESVKMKDLTLNAHAQDTRYYDVTYKLYSLNVPEPTPEAPPVPVPRKKSGVTTAPTDDSEDTK